MRAHGGVAKSALQPGGPTISRLDAVVELAAMAGAVGALNGGAHLRDQESG